MLQLVPHEPQGSTHYVIGGDPVLTILACSLGHDLGPQSVDTCAYIKQILTQA